MKAPYYTKTQVDSKVDDLEVQISNVSDGTSGKAYPDLTTAMAVDPLPDNGVIFTIDESNEAEKGIYAYDSTEVEGYRFVREFIAPKLIRGKNMFDKESVQTNRAINSSGNIVSTGYSEDVISQPIPVQEGETYTVSGYEIGGSMNKIAVYLNENLVKVGNSERIASTSTFVNNFSFIVPEGIGVKYVVISVSYHGDANAINTIQMELGSQPTYYVPYKDRVAEIGLELIMANALIDAEVVTHPTLPKHPISKDYFDTQLETRLEGAMFRTTYEYPEEIPFTHTIQKVSQTFKTNYDWNSLKELITGVTYFVDPIDGSDENDGSEANPFKSIHEALSKTDINVLMLKPSVYYYSESWQGVVPPNDLKVLIWGEGVAEVTTALDLTFSLTSGQENTYQATSSQTIGKVIDKSNTLEDGVYVELIKRSSIALVESNPNSFYYDSTADILYIHTFDDRTPDSYILPLFDGNNGNLGTSTNNVYIENVHFFGGSPMIYNCTSPSVYREATFLNCRFSYATLKDGFLQSGRTKAYIKECRVDYNQGDGFNYNGNAASFEWFCIGKYNGLNATSNSNNGSTGHADSKIIRVKCDYQYSKGKPVQDVENTISYNIEVTSGNSIAVITNVDSSCFGTNSIGTGLTEMYLIDCQCVGYTYKYINFSNSIMYIRGGNVQEEPKLDNGGEIILIDKIIEIKI